MKHYEERVRAESDLPKDILHFGQWIWKRHQANDVLRHAVRTPSCLYVDFLFGGDKYVYCANRKVSAAGISCESLDTQLKAFEFALRKGSWAGDAEKKKHRIDLLTALHVNHQESADWFRREAESFTVRVD